MGSRSKTKVHNELSTEELIYKVCNEFMEKIDKSMDEKFVVFRDKLNEVTNSVSSLNNTVRNNVKDISQLNKKVDALEQASKNNTLRICGLNEEEDECSVVDHVANFFSEKLGVTCRAEDFISIYRINKIDSKKDKPRIVLVKFANLVKRKEVFLARKLLKGGSVFIFEDLTKIRFNLLNAAKKKLGNRNAWSIDGNIYVWSEENQKKLSVTCEEDLLL